MTLLPSHDAKDRPDLPEYELGPYCSAGACRAFREEGGGHHIWRRSNQTKSWWVESDGGLFPNRVGLCWQHHRDVTGDIGGHKAEIIIHDSGNLHYRYIGQEGNEVRLHFDPDPYSVLGAVGGHEKFETPVVEVHTPKPGETCALCARRVPHPKKPSSPKTKVFSVRVPLDDLELWEEALDAAASHLGLGKKPHHRFQALNAGLALILQGPKGLLE